MNLKCLEAGAFLKTLRSIIDDTDMTGKIQRREGAKWDWTGMNDRCAKKTPVPTSTDVIGQNVSLSADALARCGVTAPEVLLVRVLALLLRVARGFVCWAGIFQICKGTKQNAVETDKQP